jgi:hypothetical protein
MGRRGAQTCATCPGHGCCVALRALGEAPTSVGSVDLLICFAANLLNLRCVPEEALQLVLVIASSTAVSVARHDETPAVG